MARMVLDWLWRRAWAGVVGAAAATVGVIITHTAVGVTGVVGVAGMEFGDIYFHFT